MLQKKIRLIYPSSRELNPTLLEERIKELRTICKEVLYAPFPSNPYWPYEAGTLEDRLQDLVTALEDPESEVVLCARGGYGGSDLLSYIPWERLKSVPEKWFVGFSDISSLMSALFTKLGWKTISGPLPISKYWGENSREDIQTLWSILNNSITKFSQPLDSTFFPHLGEDEPIDGWLFGGCFSVLTNLLGTPYFPSSLSGAILFLEDIAENPGRLLRYWNQWILSGALQGVRAVIVGQLVNLDSPLSSFEVKKEFAKRSGLKVFSSDVFGHASPNFPLIVGARGRIEKHTLHFWSN